MNAKQAREATDKAVDGMGVQRYLNEITASVQEAASQGRGKCSVTYQSCSGPNKEMLDRIYKHFREEGFRVDLSFSTTVDTDPPMESRITLSW